MPPEPPTLVELGVWTEPDFRAVPEFNGDYTNRAGIVDDKVGIRTRANASYPRFLEEMWFCVNEVFAGRKVVPGIGTPAESVKWRPGDDGAQSVNATDVNFYAIPLPQIQWSCAKILASEPAGVDIEIDSAEEFDTPLWSLENVRSGVDVGGPFFQFKTFGLRGTPEKHYRSESDVDDLGLGGEVSVCAVFNLPQWPQTNEGVVLISHRRFDVADETGTASRLGWELRLRADDFALQYRDRDSADSERRIDLKAGDGLDEGVVYLPWNREHHICFQRYIDPTDGNNFHVRLLINGQLIYDESLGTTVNSIPGNSPNMRVLLGANWDGNMSYGGATRNVMIWTDGMTQPSVAQIRTIYQIGAGFIPKASIPS